MNFDLFDTTGFPPRWHCGNWTDLHGWIHIISDLALFGAYAAIPLSIAFYVLRKKQEIIFKKLYWLFALFIVACGFSHLIEVTIFWHPWYRLSALIKVITAVASWGTVWVLWRDLPIALELPGMAKINDLLRKEIQEKKTGQEERDRLLISERDAREAAEAANRAKDEFLATLSHELRTPLNAIVGWTHLLRSGADRDELEQGLEVIERNSKLQAELIEDLLDMSRIASGKVALEKEPLDLARLVRDVVGTVQNSAQNKGLSLIFEVPVNPCMMEGDPGRLQQLLTNLLTNAIKFTPAPGTVEITLGDTPQGGGADGFEIRISDSGIGIDPKFLPSIFEKFTQADSSSTRQYGGLGIGLAIVKNLTEMHGGKIRVESEGTGRGAKFFVTLPKQSSTEKQTRQEDLKTEIPKTKIDLQGLRIVVLDDDGDSTDMLKIYLEQHGGIVHTSQSGMEALRHLEKKACDVVISDLSMPEMDGYGFIKKLREQQGDSCRSVGIALTGFGFQEKKDRALQCGFDHVLTKPVTPQDLLVFLHENVSSGELHRSDN